MQLSYGHRVTPSIHRFFDFPRFIFAGFFVWRERESCVECMPASSPAGIIISNKTLSTLVGDCSSSSRDGEEQIDLDVRSGLIESYPSSVRDLIAEALIWLDAGKRSAKMAAGIRQKFGGVFVTNDPKMQRFSEQIFDDQELKKGTPLGSIKDLVFNATGNNDAVRMSSLILATQMLLHAEMVAGGRTDKPFVLSPSEIERITQLPVEQLRRHFRAEPEATEFAFSQFPHHPTGQPHASFATH